MKDVSISFKSVHFYCNYMVQQKAKGIVQEEHNAFITGKAGTGKTFLLSHLCDGLKNDAKTVSVTCTTGIACKSLPPDPSLIETRDSPPRGGNS